VEKESLILSLRVKTQMADQQKRKLAAIMFTDIVGYSSIMESDEERGRLLRHRHKGVFEDCTSRYGGKIVQYYGDGTLSVFDSAVQAVEAAVCMQRSFREKPIVPLRIGIHLGDILYDETEVFGHGVNVAARIEPVCNPGGIFVSDKVFDEIKNHSALKAKPLGVYDFKNIDRNVGLYAIQEKGVAMPRTSEVALIREMLNKISLSSVAERSEAIRRFQTREKKTRRRKIARWSALALFVVMALAVFGIWGRDLFLPPPVPEGKVAIAVLPFVNLSGTMENEYFSDGITEDILTLLSRIEGFSVTSRTSVMQYKSTEKSIPRIARELGVNHILEGSVRRDGDQVRISAQLIDAEKDEHLWADSYDAQLTSIFEVQSQVAGDIAHTLKKKLSARDEMLIAERRSSRRDVAAYEDYLKGRSYYLKYTQEDNQKAIEYFNSALQKNPGDALALAGLGDAYAQKAYRMGLDKEVLDSALVFCEAALENNPELSEGHKALGLVYQYMGEDDAALASYEKALAFDPANDMATNNMSLIHKKRGAYTDAAVWAHRTLEINPNVPAAIMNLAGLYLDLGDNETAKKVLVDGAAAHPDFPAFHNLLGEIALSDGDLQTAETQARKLIDLDPESVGAYILLGNIKLYERNWDEAEAFFEIATASDKLKHPLRKTMVQTLKMYSRDQQNPGASIKDKAEWNELLQELDSYQPDSDLERREINLFKSGIYSALGETEGSVKCFQEAANQNLLNLDFARHPAFQSVVEIPEIKVMMEGLKSKADSVRFEIRTAVNKS
jgi:adenylate cyclase